MNIVQIGTNRANDDVTVLAKEHKEKLTGLLLVEPLKSHNEFILECYKDFPQAILENVCIAQSNGSSDVTMYKHELDGPGFQCASTKRDHIVRHCDKPGVLEERVPCMTLPNLLRKHHLKEIDVLWVDTEGTDDLLIYSLDLEEFNIHKIVFEHLHIDAESLIKYLENKGYSITRNVGADKFSHEAVKT